MKFVRFVSDDELSSLLKNGVVNKYTTPFAVINNDDNLFNTVPEIPLGIICFYEFYDDDDDDDIFRYPYSHSVFHKIIIEKFNIPDWFGHGEYTISYEKYNGGIYKYNITYKEFGFYSYELSEVKRILHKGLVP